MLRINIFEFNVQEQQYTSAKNFNLELKSVYRIKLMKKLFSIPLNHS